MNPADVLLILKNQYALLLTERKRLSDAGHISFACYDHVVTQCTITKYRIEELERANG